MQKRLCHKTTTEASSSDVKLPAEIDSLFAASASVSATNKFLNIIIVVVFVNFRLN